MKRMVAVLLAAALLMLAVPALAADADGFEIDENGVLTRYSGPGGEVTIPAGVTAIGEGAFYSCESLTGVTIPAGVTSIGDDAFYECKNMTHVTLPEGLTQVGFRAFFQCTGLTAIVIPKSLTVIGNESFSNCSKVTSLTIPEGVTAIGAFAFSGFWSLTELTLPSTLRSIGHGAFYYCTGLQRVTLPAELTDIGGRAFGNTPWQTAMGDFPVVNGVLLAYQGTASDVTVPSTATVIGEQAFYDLSGVRSVTLPASVTSIGTRAFYGCAGLSGLTVRGSIESIGSFAFDETPWLASQREFVIVGDYLIVYRGSGGDVEIPEGVKTIGERAFAKAESLKSVTLPASLRSIGDRAFSYCANLKTVRAASSLTEVGKDVFEGCNALEEAVFPAAARPAIPMKSNNLARSRYIGIFARYGESADSCLSWDGEGYVRAENVDGLLIVERYSPDFRLLSSRSLANDLTGEWGGFFIGQGYNFVFTGHKNPEEDDGAPVVTVTKYSKQWEKLGEASLYGANTTVPFRAGALRCAEAGDMLYVHTCHEMYRSDDGLNHQANMTFALRQSDMTITDAQYEVSFDYAYVSHSFDQYILADGDGDLVTLDLGDAFPRSLLLQKYEGKAGKETFGGWTTPFAPTQYPDVELLQIPGGIGSNTTGVSAGGLGETESGIVAVWNYDGVGAASSGSTSDDPAPVRNVFFSWTDKDDFSEEGTKTRQLTEFPAEGDVSAGIPALVPAGPEGGWILWEVVQVDRDDDRMDGEKSVSVAWVRYDADGNVGEIRTAPGALSDCPPICVNGKAVWYVTEDSVPIFYTLDDSGLRSQAAAWQEPVKVSAKGQTVRWTDAEPFIDASSRTMVPLRAVAEALGLAVTWDGQAREAVFTDGTKTLAFPIGSTEARTGDGGTVVMDTAAVIVGGRTYAPIRYLAEYFGYQVSWDGNTRTVLLTGAA